MPQNIGNLIMQPEMRILYAWNLRPILMGSKEEITIPPNFDVNGIENFVLRNMYFTIHSNQVKFSRWLMDEGYIGKDEPFFAIPGEGKILMEETNRIAILESNVLNWYSIVDRAFVLGRTDGEEKFSTALNYLSRKPLTVEDEISLNKFLSEKAK